MDTEKENLKPGLNKRTRTKKEQFQMIISFYEKYNEELINPEQFDKLWNILADELNGIGPPTHTNTEWRRVWTDHKYNRKRKQSSDKALEGNVIFILKP